MAITTITNAMVSVNAIQGTLIADNAITAVHIATNAVSGTLIADNAVTATHIAQNTITVTQLADDAVEADKIADGVITTNHLNKAMISSQTEVTPVAGDFVLIGDTSDSNNLKKTPISGINGLVDLSSKLSLSGGTLTGNLTGKAVTLAPDTAGKLTIRLTTNAANDGRILLRSDTTDKVDIQANGASYFNGGNVGIGEPSPAAPLHVEHSSGTAYNGAAEILESLIVSNKAGTDDSGVNNVASIGLHVADGATSQGFINYVRTGNNTGKFTFTQRTAASTYAEAMQITNDGKVGIGSTNTPSNTLDIGSGNLMLANQSELRSRDSSGNEKTIVRVNSSNQLEYGWSGAGDVKFMGGGSYTERMRVDTDGTVQIGNIRMNAVSSNSQIEAGNVHFKVGAGIWMSGSSSLDLQLQVPVTGVGISTAAKLDAPTGDWYTNDGTVSNLSDSRLKKEITTLSDGINIVKQLRPVTYKYDDTTVEDDGSKGLATASDTIRYGFVAQEVEAVASHYVTTREGKIKGETVSDLKSTSMTRMIPMLVKAIQELEAEIQALKG